jgi:hypothetical protein
MYRQGANILGFVSQGVERVTISNDAVGINDTTPAYALDVVARNATDAAVQIGSWPRMSTTSNFFWVRGMCNALVSTNRIRWNTTSTSPINTNIMTWTDSATNGSYFTILKKWIFSGVLEDPF